MGQNFIEPMSRAGCLIDTKKRVYQEGEAQMVEESSEEEEVELGVENYQKMIVMTKIPH